MMFIVETQAVPLTMHDIQDTGRSLQPVPLAAFSP
jgi:hypothetical protein